MSDFHNLTEQDYETISNYYQGILSSEAQQQVESRAEEDQEFRTALILEKAQRELARRQPKETLKTPSGLKKAMAIIKKLGDGLFDNDADSYELIQKDIPNDFEKIYPPEVRREYFKKLPFLERHILQEASIDRAHVVRSKDRSAKDNPAEITIISPKRGEDLSEVLSLDFKPLPARGILKITLVNSNQDEFEFKFDIADDDISLPLEIDIASLHFGRYYLRVAIKNYAEIVTTFFFIQKDLNPDKE